MKVAIVGCTHGELDIIYEALALIQELNNIKVELLICCGDFQAVRNRTDLQCMAVPPKYQKLCSFHKYYSGEKTAPILTLFIGGNHEATNYLQELPYGGWVATNIYYLGYAGVVQYKGVRIGGLSGIFKAEDYLKGHHEFPPYSESTKRSAYHVRNLEIFRLSQIERPIDIFISHDWPMNITKHGDVQKLLSVKPFLSADIYNQRLGNPTTETLLHKIQPRYWFSAHLHCKFSAIVKHDQNKDIPKTTKFLALDKCLPRRPYMQILDISPCSHDTSHLGEHELCYDPEWLTVLKLTDHLLSVEPRTNYMPGHHGNERFTFTPSEQEIAATLGSFGELKVPDNFCKTAPAHSDQSFPETPLVTVNPQTQNFCQRLGVRDPNTLLASLHFIRIHSSPQPASKARNPSEIRLSDDEKEEEISSHRPEVEIHGEAPPEGFIVDKAGDLFGDNSIKGEKKHFKRRNQQYYTAEGQDD